MLLSHKTTVKLTKDEANIVAHMCYAAYKLWNVCNHERKNYRELGLEKYPDWYYQKSHHKDGIWYRSLPSQTAQEVCKQLDKAWKSYFALVKSGGIENPGTPRYKQEGICITYMQNGMQHDREKGRIRFSLSKGLRKHMSDEYGINARYLYLENCIFQDIDAIKQIKMYPPEKNGEMKVIMIYETEDPEEKADNGKYLGIDLGLHNLMTCYDSDGSCFILGRRYLDMTRYYDKEIGRVQAQWYEVQARMGVRYPKTSKHIQGLYKKKKDTVNDYLHKVTKYVADYCSDREINTVVTGDLKNIRKENDLGQVTNQKLHALPYEKLCEMLEYKLKQRGIRLIMQEESYSSQCSPFSEKVGKAYAEKRKRVKRGLYRDSRHAFNADAVGAYNILRKYYACAGIEKVMPVTGLSNVTVKKVAV